MCGILGVAGRLDAARVVIEGLKRLEYRGYDSSGLAIVGPESLVVRRAVGAVANLAALEQPPGAVGVGHTRWATHGAPTERNAHPHLDCDARIAVVHNGIIENHAALREKLEANGHVFLSDTDTEVIAHLVEEHLPGDLAAAVRSALRLVEGSYAVAVVSRDAPDRIVAARNRSPLLVGLADGHTLLASDAPAIFPHTRRVVFLEDEDVAEITASGVTISTLGGAARRHVVIEMEAHAHDVEASDHPHHMLREIHQTPRAFRELLRGRTELVGDRFDVQGKLTEADIRRAKRIVVLACGTSHYAGIVGRTIVERLARVPVEVHLASEFRYAPFVSTEETLAIVVSQSGETADTIEALKKARSVGCKTLAIVNVAGSTLARDADGVFLIRAGPEVGVASTKAFVNTLGAFHLLGLHLARVRGALTLVQTRSLLSKLEALPSAIERVCAKEHELRALADEAFAGRDDAFFLGRQESYGLALEGALKLKEISYVHAEGYAAGELKHGPLALVVEGMPVVALVPASGPSYAVMLSNLMEVKARGGRVLGILAEGDARARAVVDDAFEVPATDPVFFPVPASVALYLLSYHVALARGCPIDKPRNLAKSVTVE